MVFDPLSIIGYVGTAAGLISFLVSTITRLEQCGRDFAETKPKLEWYDDQLRSICGELEAWKHLWCNGYSESDYRHFWGEDGFRAVDRKWNLIKHEIDRIGLILYAVPKSGGRDSELDWPQWEQKLDQLKTVRSFYSPDPTFIDRVVFASTRGSELKDRITYLKGTIDGLKNDSRRLLFEMQFQPTTSHHVDDDLLLKVVEQRDWAERHNAILRALYEHSKQWGNWSLVLSLPDEEGGPSSITSDVGMRIEFDTPPFDAPRGATPDLGIVDFYPSEFSGTSPDLLPWYQEKLRFVARVHIPDRTGYLASCFHTLRSPEYRIRLARTAIGIVNWTLLLWQTPWTDGICSCRIRFVTIDLPNGTSGTLSTFNASQTCSKDSRNHVNRKALLIGVSLAELALQNPIEVNVHADASRHFIVDGQIVQEEHLLERIMARTSWDYRSAVWYCLRYDGRLQDGHTFRTNDVNIFQENVIKRLVKYLGACEKSRGRRRKTTRS